MLKKQNKFLDFAFNKEYIDLFINKSIFLLLLDWLLLLHPLSNKVADSKVDKIEKVICFLFIKNNFNIKL